MTYQTVIGIGDLGAKFLGKGIGKCLYAKLEGVKLGAFHQFSQFLCNERDMDTITGVVGCVHVAAYAGQKGKEDLE